MALPGAHDRNRISFFVVCMHVCICVHVFVSRVNNIIGGNGF
jgi:hypothetical protein